MVQPVSRTADLNLRASGLAAAHCSLPGGPAGSSVLEPPGSYRLALTLGTKELGPLLPLTHRAPSLRGALSQPPTSERGVVSVLLLGSLQAQHRMCGTAGLSGKRRQLAAHHIDPVDVILIGRS
jgi:hypothetical protein